MDTLDRAATANRARYLRVAGITYFTAAIDGRGQV